jgi:hypothetical protein
MKHDFRFIEQRLDQDCVFRCVCGCETLVRFTSAKAFDVERDMWRCYFMNDQLPGCPGAPGAWGIAIPVLDAPHEGRMWLR